MPARSKVTLRLIGAGTALMLVAAVPVAGSAQQSDAPARRAKSDQGAGVRPASKAAKPRPRADASRNKAGAPGRQWMLQDALPDHSAALRQYETPASPGIGRVPLRSGPGTFGFETQTQVKAHQTPDGRTIPGLEANANRSQSYLGLSLSVPSSDKNMNIPVPQWGRP